MVRDWISPEPRFEDIYKSGPQTLSDEEQSRLVESFAQVTAPTLAVSMSDDEFGTIPAFTARSATSRTACPRTCVSNPMLLVSLQLATSRFQCSLCGLLVEIPWLGYAMAKSPRRFRSAGYAGEESVIRASVRIQSIKVCV